MPLACMKWMRRALLFPDSKDEEYQATRAEIVGYIVSGQEDGPFCRGRMNDAWHRVH